MAFSVADLKELIRIVRKDRSGQLELRQQMWNKDHLVQVNGRIKVYDELIGLLSDEIERLEENG